MLLHYIKRRNLTRNSRTSSYIYNHYISILCNDIFQAEALVILQENFFKQRNLNIEFYAISQAVIKAP